jgi:large subunit ribosomal protein L15
MMRGRLVAYKGPHLAFLAKCPLWARSSKVSLLSSPLLLTRLGLAKIHTSIVQDPNDIALNTLRDNPGAKKKARRTGRGVGSKRGKTSGYGHKGQKARGGKIKAGFEGGQTPLYKRVRKYGFSNKMHARRYLPLNLARIQWWIDTGRLDPTQKITMKTLCDVGLVSRPTKYHEHGIKLLADGAEWFKAKLDMEVSKVSKAARAAVEREGGTVKEVYYHHRLLRIALRPKKTLPPPQEYRTQPAPTEKSLA